LRQLGFLVFLCVITADSNVINRNGCWVCIFGAGYEGELWIDDSDHTDCNDFDAVSLDELVSGFVHFLLIK